MRPGRHILSAGARNHCRQISTFLLPRKTVLVAPCPWLYCGVDGPDASPRRKKDNTGQHRIV